jgi:choline dehydrogenase
MDQLTPTAATETFEYIVVGAGSAGCVLAYRLAEAGRSVLVLEAGGDDRGVDEIAIPAAFPNLFKTEHDWDYETVEQKHAHGRRMYWPRGKVLGGSSSINAQLYVRGNALDYDTWRDRHGCSGWGYADLLPYFLRSEDNVRGASQYHGVGGPLRVEDGRFTHELCHAFVDAAVSYGIEPNEDFNGARQEGAGLFQVTQRSGRRWSAADAYLRPATEMSGVQVRTHALVTQVVLDGGRAVGVRWLAGGVEHEARAEAEVLLSGGAVNSPQLLMLSGIGPAEHLRGVGIDPVADLPGTGANLQDHPIAMTCYASAVPLPRSRYNHGETYSALSSPLAGAWPDLHVFPILLPVAPPGLKAPAGGFALVASAVAPDSRGSVRVASASPLDAPLIDPGLLREPRDVERLEAGLAMIRRAAAGSAFARLGVTEVHPGPEVLGGELRAWTRRTVSSYYHPAGTCRIGPGTDQGAVVDPELRVHGITGLRVADASVTPVIPNAHPNATVLAIAERAAGLIAGQRSRSAHQPRPHHAATDK